jgi:methyl-accepting chemotaxis protein
MEPDLGDPRAPVAFRRLSGRLLAAAGGGALFLAGVSLVLERSTANPLLTPVFLCAAGAVWLWALDRALRPRLAGLDRLLEGVRRLAQGDFRTPFPHPEPGELSHWLQALNHLAARLDRIACAAREVAERAKAVPKLCDEPLRAIERSSLGQESAATEVESRLAEIDGSIQAINEDLENLSGASEEASSSILEMGTSINEIARNTAALEESADSSAAMTHQMGGNTDQVAASAASVQEMAEETAGAMTQMDRAIHEVSEHVREASVLTERLSEGSEEGSRAVASTIDGIEAIRKLTLEARDVLERLAGRIAEIGEIVTVIGSVNEETNLLSLNAAIIAAQAGEQGKAFAVVANHVKTLAERTALSTQEIDRLIQAVQEESGNAVRAMGTGMQAVETGVERSRRAGQALEAIRLSAHDATSRVAEIARATAEQTRNSKHVTQAARRTSEMVQEITRALGEQQRASQQMLRNAASALETCRQVHRSTQEQRESSRFVASSISSISEKIRSIQESTEAHARAGEAVAETVTRFLQVGQDAGRRMLVVISLIQELAGDAERLVEEFGPVGSAQGAPELEPPSEASERPH